MNKKKGITALKNLEGDYDIEIKLRPCCCKRGMDKVYDTFNGNYFWLCRVCGNIKNDVTEVIR